MNGIEKVILVGTSGHARAVAAVFESEGRHCIAGLIDSFQSKGIDCFGYPIVGAEAELGDICTRLGVFKLFIAIGDNYQREAMALRVLDKRPDLELISALHPSAIVGADVEIGEGTVIMPGSVVVSGCRIGAGCILNTSCSLDHDGIMHDWSSLAPGAATGGNVSLGKRSSVGLGASVIQKVSIGQDTVVGAGALVLNDLPDRVVAYGSPCRVARHREVDEKYV